MGVPREPSYPDLDGVVSIQDQQAEAEAWFAEKEAQAEYARRRAEFQAQEVALANKVVGEVLANYRWWGLSNIVNTVRIWIQCWRQRHAKDY